MNHSVFSIIPLSKNEDGCYPIINKGRVFKYTLPLHYPLPLKTTQLTTRCGLIIELTSEAGKVVYGEAAPLPDFSTESLVDVEQGLHDAINQLIHAKTTETISFNQTIPSVAFAMESALWGLEFTQWRPATVVAPLLIGLANDVREKLIGRDQLCPAEFKLKVARGSLEKDVQSVIKVLSILPDHVRLRLDANQRWSLDQAISFCSLLAVNTSDLAERIAYIEEPTDNPQEFSEFYQKTGIGYALDESLQQGKEPDFSNQDGLRVIVIKPTLSGGLSYCQTLLEQARANNIRFVLSSAFESMIGVHWLQQLSAFWTPEEMSGLDTSSAFADNLVDAMPAPGCPLSDTAINKMEFLWELRRA